jgi:hypothetical protein
LRKEWKEGKKEFYPRESIIKLFLESNSLAGNVTMAVRYCPENGGRWGFAMSLELPRYATMNRGKFPE